ncbi:hypothetical protein [Dysgonomonas sp. 521]|uniref:hypothetical protein n=1 Tax=Dysgonomonas sp. 521 TaxID=2302932 RepID=UPI0013D1E6AD|nr:hypothetical protein [Dysgonomonas sp. 521]
MKSTFRTLFYLKKNQPRKDKTVPIMVKVTVNGNPQSRAKQYILLHWRLHPR